jgi:tRNA dimethylallyltransferase
LFAEVQALLDAGIDPSLPVFSTIGYREVLPYLRGEISEQDAIDAIRFSTNRLVRHQQTWFRKNPDLVRIDMSDPQAISRVLEQVVDFTCA